MGGDRKVIHQTLKTSDQFNERKFGQKTKKVDVCGPVQSNAYLRFYQNEIGSKNISDLIKTRSAKTFPSEPVLIKAGPLIIFCK
jgi:hypothetical protein